MKNAKTLFAAAVATAAVINLAPAAHALSPYTTTLDFKTPASWSADALYTTSQQWDTKPGFETVPAGDDFPWTAAPPVNGTNNFFDNNNQPGGASLTTPILNVSGAINATPYLINGGSPQATIFNYGGATGGPVATSYVGTHVIVQLGATVGSIDFNGTQMGYSVVPGSLKVYAPDGSTVLADDSIGSTTLLQKGLISTQFSSIPNPVTGEGSAVEQWLYEFYLPNWTGDIKVGWTHNFHTVFEAVRVDTALSNSGPFALTPVPEPASLGLLGLAAAGLLARRRQSV